MSAPRGALPRRAVLAGVVGVAAVAATLAAAADPDAELLTLCRDFQRAEADLSRFTRAACDRWGVRLPEHVEET